MNKRQKEVQQLFLDNEKKVLKELERNYQDALAEINGKIEVLTARNDADLAHVIYRVEHQKALKRQIEASLESLHTNEFETVSEFLAKSYEDGFIGTMYDMHGQGVPLVLLIDQKQIIEAIQHETKLSESLYASLGHDIKDLQKKIAEEISRGISTGQGYGEIARNIADYAKIPKNRAMTIARTESHRIQCHAADDAQHKAKEKGADVLKQWDAALDGDTRPTHRQLDGQIRELDEPFEAAGKKAKYPGAFGDPAEDCNCRCALLQRARWALGKEELDTLKDRAKYFGLDKTKDFTEFKDKYLKAAKTLENTGKSGIIKVSKSVGAAGKNYPVKLPDSNQHVKLAIGQTIQGKVFAGKGTDEEIRDRFRLESAYGIPAEEWEKVSGEGKIIVDGKEVMAELHWYEANGEAHELKVKRFVDDES